MKNATIADIRRPTSGFLFLVVWLNHGKKCLTDLYR